jgi:hypothetical protein
MSVQRGLGAGITPNFALNDILQMTQKPPAQGGKFRQVLGGVVGGVGNLFMPGIGTAIGGLISGGRMNSTGLLGESSQFLELQRQIQMETRAFETASAVLKSRHDAAMSAIRNMK